ncbi:hypothetical protein IIDPJIOB_00029 [Aeromonas veronii]|mgnify:FL=1
MLRCVKHGANRLMRNKFKNKAYFADKDKDYTLFPFNFERLSQDEVLIVNAVGEFSFIQDRELQELVAGELPTDTELYQELKRKSFLAGSEDSYALRCLSAKYRQRKSFLSGGPGLHIFVITLRCGNSCEYCQASRKSVTSSQHDMSQETARNAVDRVFESPNQRITIEFQGGEPLLAFDLIKFIVDYAHEKNSVHGKSLVFVIATSLQYITDEMLDFIKLHSIQISTSLDGPEALHNKNRPSSCGNSYQSTLAGIRKVREAIGDEAIAAMTTITKDSLPFHQEIVDEYVKHGFHSIFLRPLNMYGFAVKRESKVSYTSAEYFAFYQKSLQYIIDINKAGYYLDEVTASLALNNMLTGRAVGYVDLRSPCGDGTGVLVYHYNSYVYPSDEARMLYDMGDNKFCLGSVEAPYVELISSDVMGEILMSGVAESLPACAYCAYLPYCGANPIQNYSRTGDLGGHRAKNDFCNKQKPLYRHLFSLLEENKDVFTSWVTRGK